MKLLLQGMSDDK